VRAKHAITLHSYTAWFFSSVLTFSSWRRGYLNLSGTNGKPPASCGPSSRETATISSRNASGSASCAISWSCPWTNTGTTWYRRASSPALGCLCFRRFCCSAGSKPPSVLAPARPASLGVGAEPLRPLRPPHQRRRKYSPILSRQCPRRALDRYLRLVFDLRGTCHAAQCGGGGGDAAGRADLGSWLGLPETRR
jgi:hypothetical protein